MCFLLQLRHNNLFDIRNACADDDCGGIDKYIAKAHNIIGMKVDKRIKAIVIAPVAIGFILIVIGIVSRNESVFEAGIIVLFGGSGVAALISVLYTLIKIRRGNYINSDVSAENDENVKTVEKAGADDADGVENGKSSAVRAVRKKLTDRDKEYRDKIEDELTHESERLLEMDNVTDADIDELADREIEIEMEFIKSDETDEDFDSYVSKRRLLYDEMRRKIMKNPPLDDEPFDESEAETPFVEFGDKDEPEKETPSVEPTDMPPTVSAVQEEPETPHDVAKAAEASTDIEVPTVAAKEDGGSTEPETPSHVPTEPVRQTRTKRDVVGYKGIKKK